MNLTKKLFFYFFATVFSVFCTLSCGKATKKLSSNDSDIQQVQLPNEAKFKMGDNLEWAKESYDDHNWESKQLAKSWAATGEKENVFAWYRLKIVIPSSMKIIAEKGNGIKLNLGKIDDVDQTFFNGILIGESGSLPPNYISNWDKVRQYTIPVKEVLWDQENVIAIRVFSPDIGGVGMYEGPYFLSPIQWSDFIDVKPMITETKDNGFITKINFTNQSDKGLDAVIYYAIKDKNNTVLFTESKPFIVKSGKDSVSEFSTSNYVPKQQNIFKVSYQIIENDSRATVKYEQVYLSDKNIKIEVKDEPKPVVVNKIKNIYTALPIQNQQFNGYLNTRFTQNLYQRLLNVDEFGLMGSYLNRPGIHPWAGEHVGKYLEAACNIWKLTHNAALKQQMDRMMYELINTQLTDGYLGTYLPNDYWTSWDVWSHKYNLHGLLAYYETTGYQPALEASKKIGDLLYKTFGKNAGQRDIILAGEHKGMAATSVLDAMVELYRFTGDKKYLDFCYYIVNAWEQDNGPKVISAILKTGKVTNVGDGKAYEMLSNYVGLAKLYQVTRNPTYLKAIEMAWKDIVENRLYITGTTSSWEYFQDAGVLPASDNDHMGEGCVTTTWIQLNQNLFAITGDVKYLEQLEKSTYNHLLAAENPETGCVSYYTPLMSKKPYTCYMTCCQSSVPRGIALVPYFTFGNINNTPTLLLYEPATYEESVMSSTNKKIDLTLNLEGNVLDNGKTTISIKTSQTATFFIALRVPSWCKSFSAKIGNQEYKGISGQYLNITNTWKSGDKINISMDIPIQTLSGGKSYPNQFAFKRGPQILALDDSLNSELILNTAKKLPIENPKFKSNVSLLPSQWIGKQTFTVKVLDKKGNLTKQKLVLIPFADASQTGGDVKVWLPFKISRQ